MMIQGVGVKPSVIRKIFMICKMLISFCIPEMNAFFWENLNCRRAMMLSLEYYKYSKEKEDYRRLVSLFGETRIGWISGEDSHRKAQREWREPPGLYGIVKWRDTG